MSLIAFADVMDTDSEALHCVVSFGSWRSAPVRDFVAFLAYLMRWKELDELLHFRGAPVPHLVVQVVQLLWVLG